MLPYRWYAIRYRNGLTYARHITAGKSFYMHNLIMGYVGIDHENGNGLDNRRRNLRPASKSENGANAGKRGHSSSRLKGVYLSRRVNGSQGGRPWYALISPRGTRLYLGSFETEESAAEAYDKAALEHFGEFALTNKGMGLL